MSQLSNVSRDVLEVMYRRVCAERDVLKVELSTARGHLEEAASSYIQLKIELDEAGFPYTNN